MKDSVSLEPTQEQKQIAFRNFLRQADKYIIEKQFEEARREIAEARKINPNNPFIVAFEERIALFQHKGGRDYPHPSASGLVTASKVPETKHTVSPDQEVSSARGEAEQEFRRKLEEEYRQKFTHELQKAKALAQKIFE